MDIGTDTEEAQKQRVARKRIAIAAEALSNASDVKIPNIPKTEAVLRVLGERSDFNTLLHCVYHAAHKDDALYVPSTTLTRMANDSCCMPVRPDSKHLHSI